MADAAFLDDIDAPCKDQGFKFRSEFLRPAARDADSFQVLLGGLEAGRGERTRPPIREGRLVSREDVRAMMDRNRDADAE